MQGKQRPWTCLAPPPPTTSPHLERPTPNTLLHFSSCLCMQAFPWQLWCGGVCLATLLLHLIWLMVWVEWWWWGGGSSLITDKRSHKYVAVLFGEKAREAGPKGWVSAAAQVCREITSYFSFKPQFLRSIWLLLVLLLFGLVLTQSQLHTTYQFLLVYCCLNYDLFKIIFLKLIYLLNPIYYFCFLVVLGETSHMPHLPSLTLIISMYLFTYVCFLNDFVTVNPIIAHALCSSLCFHLKWNVLLKNEQANLFCSVCFHFVFLPHTRTVLCGVKEVSKQCFANLVVVRVQHVLL